MAKLQATRVPIAWGSCALGQTDGRIAVSLNAHLQRGGIITENANYCERYLPVCWGSVDQESTAQHTETQSAQVYTASAACNNGDYSLFLITSSKDVNITGVVCPSVSRTAQKVSKLMGTRCRHTSIFVQSHILQCSGTCRPQECPFLQTNLDPHLIQGSKWVCPHKSISNCCVPNTDKKGMCDM